MQSPLLQTLTRGLFPTWSLPELTARVVDVKVETPDTRTFVLRPPRGWKGHRAGQYTTVDVEIDGVRHRRCYSISSAPSEPHVAITVKRVAGGRVSSWMHEHVRPGHALRIGPAAGDFVLDAPDAPLLLIGGGSGVTPLMSILRDRGAHDVVFVLHARRREDVIFGAELEAIPGLRLIIHLDDLDEDRLAREVPDFAERRTMLCGPGGLMDRVERMWRLNGAVARLQRERFVAAPVHVPAPGAPVAVKLRARTVVADGSGTLLEQLERAGERPASGCRIGICQTCRCRKVSGVVENLRTGKISSDPDEDIQLCISRGRSDLEINL
jgi:ferredoxin-NADP reductase